jgi:hypothetical protein
MARGDSGDFCGSSVALPPTDESSQAFWLAGFPFFIALFFFVCVFHALPNGYTSRWLVRRTRRGRLVRVESVLDVRPPSLGKPFVGKLAALNPLSTATRFGLVSFSQGRTSSRFASSHRRRVSG